jgi:hypothetical protein
VRRTGVRRLLHSTKCYWIVVLTRFDVELAWPELL